MRRNAMQNNYKDHILINTRNIYMQIVIEMISDLLLID